MIDKNEKTCSARTLNAIFLVHEKVPNSNHILEISIAIPIVNEFFGHVKHLWVQIVCKEDQVWVSLPLLV